jgi:hypothetical protein
LARSISGGIAAGKEASMCRIPQTIATALLLLVPGVCAAQSVNMGSTFHGLEARARRVTTTFPDVVIDVRRGEDQAMEAILRNRTSGEEEGRLHVHATSRRVQWRRGTGGDRVSEFALPDQATVGLDWAAFELYALHVDDRAAAGGGLEVTGDEGAWDGHLRRSRRALGRGSSAGQLAARVEQVETEFDGLIVRAALDRHARPKSPGKRIDYSRFTATIVDRQTGARRGFVRWFDTAQVLTWKIEGGSQGVILPERLPGGWTFTPTMAWANVQAYQFATQAASSLEPEEPFAGLAGAVLARPGAPAPFLQIARAVAPLPSAALAVSGAVARSVVADTPALDGRWLRRWSFGGRGGAVVNEPGCDNLHWLDGSVFRACCDQHDRCYETNGCSASSWWWPFSGNWSCERCNFQVVYCFCTLSNPAYCGSAAVGSGGDGGASSGGCSSVAGGFCPVECQTCEAR